MDPLSILFPKFCCGCQKIGSLLCENCHNKIYFLSLPIKPKLEIVYLDELRAMAQYDEPVKSLIHQLKYQHVREIGKLLGRLLYFTVPYPLADVVTGTPLHKNRQTERGYNQSEVIAQEFSQLSGIPYYPLLTKTKNTFSQATLIDKSHRLKNLENVFQIDPRYQQLKANKVIIIDDVITTGTTLNEAAKVLRANDFSQIYGLSIAHGA